MHGIGEEYIRIKHGQSTSSYGRSDLDRALWPSDNCVQASRRLAGKGFKTEIVSKSVTIKAPSESLRDKRRSRNRDGGARPLDRPGFPVASAVRLQPGLLPKRP